jgi:pilus assembly protein CpaE
MGRGQYRFRGTPSQRARSASILCAPKSEGEPIAANPILLCVPGPELRLQVEESLTAVGYAPRSATSAAEATEYLRDHRWDLLVLDGAAVGGSIGVLRAASRGTVPMLVIAPAGDVEARIAFLEAGADDVLGTGFTRRELEARVQALLIRSGRSDAGDAAAAGPGQMVAVFSPKGGAGTTTIATNLALLLATRPSATRPSGSRVLIVDLDLQFGQVATHLNLTPRFDLADLVADEQALDDPEAIAPYITVHDSGLAVLAGPTHPEAGSRLTVADLEKTLAAFRANYDYLVLDCGSRLDPLINWALEQSATHLLVVSPELPALRAMREFLSYVDEAHPFRGRRLFVVNNIQAKRMLSNRDIESILLARIAVEIPFEGGEMVQAVNRGVPLVLAKPGSPAGAAFEKVAGVVAGAAPGRASAPTDAAGSRGILGFGRR